MSERLKELYRSDYLNNASGEDFVTLPSYQHSFFQAPQLSQLRMAIAPGSLKYPNKNIPPYYPIPYTLLQTEGDRFFKKQDRDCWASDDESYATIDKSHFHFE